MARAAVAGILTVALVAEVSAQQFSFRQYTQADGLTNLSATYLQHDPDGSFWVGTDGGLFRFDGTSFVAYNRSQGLPDEFLRGMEEDSSGRLWVLLDRGLFVGDVSGFKPVRTVAGPVLPDRPLTIAFTPNATALLIKDGHVIQIKPENHEPHAQWVIAPYFSASQLSATPELEKVSRLLRAADGTLWLACAKAVCSFAGGNLKVWGPADGLLSSTYNSFLIDRDRRLWARSSAHLLVKEPGAPSFTLQDPPQAQLSARTTEPMLALDPQGRLLVRTAAGLARWDGHGWEEFSAGNGLPDTVIGTTHVDAEGSVWLNPIGYGLWRWEGYDNVESWTAKQGLRSEKIWNVVRDPGGRLLIGTDRGCQVLDERSRRAVACPFTGMPDVQVTALAVDRWGGSWWGFDNFELWHASAGQSQAHKVPMPVSDLGISVLWFDRGGTGWIACYEKGLYRLDPQNSAIQKVDLPLRDARVWDVTQDSSGAIWAAASGGLFRWADGRWTFLPLNTADGLPAGFGSVTATPDGAVWASSFGKGLLRLQGTQPAQRAWILPEVIATASVYSVRSDRRGWLWANTDQGAAVFDGHEWRRVDINDGLIWNDTQQYAFYSDDDASVWIGTVTGLTHILKPERLLQGLSTLDLRIASARVGFNPLRPELSTKVPWKSDNAFDVRFSSHSFTRSPQTEFRYRLLGLSSEWFGSRDAALHLPALAAGHYTLEAMAVDVPHARQSPLVTLDFELLPPWWSTTLFRVCAVLVSAAILVFLWRWQLGRLHARRRATEREHRERQALLERATRDALTGLWNRVTIFEVLAREIEQSQRSRSALAVALVDVDHFKLINDSCGHPGGDEVLRELARRLSAALRQSDWLGRYGGEELLIVLPGLTREEGRLLLERIRLGIAEVPFTTQNAAITVTVSVGIAWWESLADTAQSIISSADTALYEAKAAGRNCVVFAPEPDPRAAESTRSRRYLPELIDRLKRTQNRP